MPFYIDPLRKQNTNMSVCLFRRPDVGGIKPSEFWCGEQHLHQKKGFFFFNCHLKEYFFSAPPFFEVQWFAILFIRWLYICNTLKSHPALEHPLPSISVQYLPAPYPLAEIRSGLLFEPERRSWSCRVCSWDLGAGRHRPRRHLEMGPQFAPCSGRSQGPGDIPLTCWFKVQHMDLWEFFSSFPLSCWSEEGREGAGDSRRRKKSTVEKRRKFSLVSRTLIKKLFTH